MKSFQSSFDLGLESFDRFFPMEPGMDINNTSIFSHQISGRHSLRPHFGHELLGMVQDDREACFEPLEELRGISRLLVGSDSDDDKATALVFLVEFLVGRKSLTAGTAPRGPKVVEDHLPFCRGHGPGDAEGLGIGKGHPFGGLTVAHRKSDDEREETDDLFFHGVSLGWD